MAPFWGQLWPYWAQLGPLEPADHRPELQPALAAAMATKAAATTLFSPGELPPLTTPLLAKPWLATPLLAKPPLAKPLLAKPPLAKPLLAKPLLVHC